MKPSHRAACVMLGVLVVALGVFLLNGPESPAPEPGNAASPASSPSPTEIPQAYEVVPEPRSTGNHYARMDISGQVVDESGKGLSGLPVLARRMTEHWEWPVAAATVTGASGAFHLRLQESGNYLISVDPDGDHALVRRDVPSGTQGLRLVVDRRASVAVVVRDGDGAAVPEATVSLFRYISDVPHGYRPGMPRIEETDESGRHVFQGITPGRYGLEAAVIGGGRATGQVEVTEGGAHEAVLVLEPGAAIGGRVVFADGSPVAGAVIDYQIKLLRADGAWRQWSIRTGESGRFVIPGADYGNVTLDVHYNQRHRLTEEFDYIPGTGPIHRELVLPNGWPVGGRVTDEAGRPVAGVTVRLYPHHGRTEIGGNEWQPPRILYTDDPDVRMEEEATTGPDGTYRFMLYRPIKYDFKFSHPDYAPAAFVMRDFEPGVPRQDLDVVLKSGIVIAGRVVDEEGPPLPEAEVECSNYFESHGEDRGDFVRDVDLPKAVTGPEGRFELKHLPRVDQRYYRVSAQSEGFISNSVLSKATSELTLILRRQQTLAFEGTVRTARDNLPYPGATVELRHANGENVVASARTDGAGQYRIGEQGPDLYALWAHSPEGLVAGPAYSSAKIDASTPERVDLLLKPTVDVRGRVVHALTGEALPNITVSLRSVQPHRDGYSGNAPWLPTIQHSYTGEDGTFLYEGLVEGDYVCRVQAQRYKHFSPTGRNLNEAGAFSIRDGEAPDEVVIKLTPKTLLTLQARYADGRPAAGLEVDLGRLDPSTLNLMRRYEPPPETTDVNGYLREIEVRPGMEAEVVFYFPEGEARSKLLVGKSEPVNLEEGEEREMVVVLPEAGALSGRVLSREGEPLKRAVVTVRNSMTYYGHRYTDDAGDFRFEALLPGEVVLYVRCRGYVSEKIERITVPEGAEISGILIRMTPGLEIRGRVTDSEMQPITGVQTQVLDKEGNPMHDSARTDEDGHFVIHSLPAGSYTVQVKTSKAPQLERDIEGVQAGAGNLWVVLEGGGAEEERDASLPPDPFNSQ